MHPISPTQAVQKVTILGATGSIGQSTIDVLACHPQQFQVFALTAHSNIRLLLAQAQQCHPEYVVVSDLTKFDEAKSLFSKAGLNCELLAGQDAL